MDNFSDLVEIPKDDFLRAKLSLEAKRNPLDETALCTLCNHVKWQGQTYYLATLTEEGFQNLIIAYHKHGEHLKVSQGGFSLVDTARTYMGDKLHPDDECWDKVHSLKAVIDREVQESGNLFPPDIMPFVSDVGDLAVHGHYAPQGSRSLYAGGYHRFAAYGLWVCENGFRPLRLHYCEVNGTAQ
jgi:hypothetical protein